MEAAFDKGLGRLPLPRDDRDFRAAVLLAASGAVTAPERTWRYWNARRAMVLDQGAEGTCEGHGWTSYLIDGPVTHPRFADLTSVGRAHAFARDLYFQATGDATYQQGAYTRQVLDVLRARNLIGGYHRCATAEEVVRTLLEVGPVGHASDWYASMFNPERRFGYSYLRVDEGSGVAGGHEYLLVGANLAPTEGPPFVLMQNSWGAGWGDAGFARIAIEDLHVLFCGDAFVLTEAAF